MSDFTAEELEMLQRRIDDPDWDISQQNDVWELLPKLLKAVEENTEQAQRITMLISDLSKYEVRHEVDIRIIESLRSRLEINSGE